MATRHRDPENAGLPTTTEQAFAILQLTTTYLDAHHLLVHPRKSVRLADTGTPTPHIPRGGPLHLGDTTVHLRVTQATRHHHITLPSKQEWRLARLPQIARWNLLSTQGGHTSWKRCSTQPSGTKSCTSYTPKKPYTTLDSK